MTDTTYIGIGVPLIKKKRVPETGSPAAKGNRALIAWDERNGPIVLLEEAVDGSFEQLRSRKAFRAREMLPEDVKLTPYNPESIPLKAQPITIEHKEKTYHLTHDRRAEHLANSFTELMQYEF